MGRLRRFVVAGVTGTAAVASLLVGVNFAMAEDTGTAQDTATGTAQEAAQDRAAGDPWGRNWRWWAPKVPGTQDRAWTSKLLPGGSIRVSTVPRCAGTFSYDLKTDRTALPVGTASFTPSPGTDCGPALDTITGLSWCNRFEVHYSGPVGTRESGCFSSDGSPTRLEVVGAGEILWAGVTMYQEMPANLRVCANTTMFTPDPEHIQPWDEPPYPDGDQ